MTPPITLSLIICTNRPGHYVQRTLDSLSSQTFSAHGWEIILVNNAPDLIDFSGLLETWKGSTTARPVLRLVDCPTRGLSHARNVGLHVAQGEIVLYLDDDVVADPALCEQISEAYTQLPEAGVIGGSVVLHVPDPAPWWYGETMALFWSEWVSEQREPFVCAEWTQYPVGANWSARRACLLEVGGFNVQYGRGSGVVDAGEETVAACEIQRLGYGVGFTPHARVTHHIDPERFTLAELFRMGHHTFDTYVAMHQEGYVPELWSWKGCFVRGVAKLMLALVPSTVSIPRRLVFIAVARGHFRTAKRLCHTKD